MTTVWERAFRRKLCSRGAGCTGRSRKPWVREYRAEVPLKHEMIMGYYMLSVEGRADGIFWRCQTAKKTEEGFSGGISVSDSGGEILTGKGRYPERDTSGKSELSDFGDLEEPDTEQIFFIDEIKCMYTDVTRFEAPFPVHLAQAKCYAYIFALQNGRKQMGVQITYCDLDTEAVKTV